MPYKKLA
ncbi:uncharacterized protein FFM5_15342 [Fusarium fujikuroi]|nr:uncharacterized protein FFM5_15322 [Fusarium fujikuroi]SCO27073.1 uncharacterized protein FFM5_15342 [Fusarium fujikuroi]